MSAELKNQLEEVNERPVGPGKRLREARKSLRLDQSDLAAQLNLEIGVIDALERDDYSGLPPTTFVRGYLQSYARLVEVPAEEIIAQYQRMLDSPDQLARPLPAAARRSGNQQVTSSDARVKWVSYAVVAALVALLALWAFGQFGNGGEEAGSAPLAEIAPPAGETPELLRPTVADERDSAEAIAEGDTPALEAEPGVPASEDPATAAVEVVAPAEEGDASVSAEADTAAATPVITQAEPVAESPPEPKPEPAPAPQSEPTATTETETDAVAEAPATPAASDRQTAADGEQQALDRLTVRAKQDAWVGIQDADDNRLLYDIVSAGNEQVVAGRSPFRVVLGNAAGTELVYAGETYDFSAAVRGNIARFQVGPGDEAAQ